MKKLFEVLRIFALSVNQVGPKCWGENVSSMVTAKEEQEKPELEFDPKKFNKKVIARLLEFEAKVDKDEDKKVEKNIFIRALEG